MSVADAWRAGREHLAASGIDEAGITAEVLLRHTLGLTRTELYLAWDRPVEAEAWTRYQAYLAERLRGRPVAYIVGHREFMGLDFLVDERVLIPRPETEVLVAAVIEATSAVAAPTIADVGTGSGAIAVSVAVLRPDATVLATDISAGALEVARTNAARHGVTDRVSFLQGDLLEPVADALRAGGYRLDVLACNPPYVAREEAASLPAEIRDFEPSEAVLVQGSAEAYHVRLITGAPGLLRPGGWLIMEVSAGQAPRVVELLDRAGVFQAVHTRHDGLGWARVVAARVGSGEAARDLVSYYSLSFDASVHHHPEPVSIIRVDPGDGAAPRKAVEALRAGGLLAFPTGEGYLVGCSALDPEAVRRLCKVTGATSYGLLRLAASRAQADRLGGSGGEVRISTDPVPLALMHDTDTPIAATPSRPGASPAPTAQHVVFVLGDRLDLILDAGAMTRQPAMARGA